MQLNFLSQISLQFHSIDGRYQVLSNKLLGFIQEIRKYVQLKYYNFCAANWIRHKKITLLRREKNRKPGHRKS
jgi:hypothetical protein